MNVLQKKKKKKKWKPGDVLATRCDISASFSISKHETLPTFAGLDHTIDVRRCRMDKGGPCGSITLYL